ncbi:MAG: PDK repeat-containing protein, partial [bacterium]
TYDVVVTVRDDEGVTSSGTFKATISNAAPILASLADQNATEGTTISLQGATFMDAGALDTHTATVDWGDGTSTAAVVSGMTVQAQHAFGDNATYDVVVTVRDDDGGLSSATFKAVIANAAPVLAVLADQTGSEGSTFILQNATFTDAGLLDTHTATVDWGDGTTVAAAVLNNTLTAQHVYGDNGTYDVTVTVRDDEGAATSGAFKAVVSNAAPALAALGDQTTAEGAVLSLQNAVFTDAGSLDTHTATVDWGDGTSEAASVSSRAVQAQHTYGDNGAYTLVLTVRDDEGALSSATFRATVTNVAPTLAALADQNAGEGSLVSLLGATFTDPGFLDTHTATVDWGDGTTEPVVVSSKALSAQHSYGDNGTYTVEVMVADDDGGASVQTFTATVGNMAPSLAPLADQAAAEGSPVSLLGASFTDPGFLDSHAATVNWGDGTTEPATISSKTVLAQHAYGDNGAFAVTVTITDDDGGASVRSFTATVSNVAPTLVSLADQSSGEGALVSLQGAAFTDPGFLDTHTATVNWGDGTVEAAAISSNTVLAQHAYGDNGAYTVTVTVTDDDTGTSTRTFVASVSNVAPDLAPLADQSASEGSPVSLLGANFSDSGLLDSHTATVDWGDGTTEAAPISSKTVYAQHAYGDNGAYTVTVTVRDDDGGTSSRSFIATIANVWPILAALANQNAAEGSVVALQGAAFTDPGFLDTHNATVDWGDGTSLAASISSNTVSAQHAYGRNGH